MDRGGPSSSGQAGAGTKRGPRAPLTRGISVAKLSSAAAPSTPSPTSSPKARVILNGHHSTTSSSSTIRASPSVRSALSTPTGSSTPVARANSAMAAFHSSTPSNRDHPRAISPRLPQAARGSPQPFPSSSSSSFAASSSSSASAFTSNANGAGTTRSPSPKHQFATESRPTRVRMGSTVTAAITRPPLSNGGASVSSASTSSDLLPPLRLENTPPLSGGGSRSPPLVAFAAGTSGSSYQGGIRSPGAGGSTVSFSSVGSGSYMNNNAPMLSPHASTSASAPPTTSLPQHSWPSSPSSSAHAFLPPSSPRSSAASALAAAQAEDTERRAKLNRKVQDLEITNASLLAINGALEKAKVKQAKEISELKRRLRESRAILPQGGQALYYSGGDDESSLGSEFDDEDGGGSEKGWDDSFAPIVGALEELLRKGRAAIVAAAQVEDEKEKDKKRVLHSVEVDEWREAQGWEEGDEDDERFTDADVSLSLLPGERTPRERRETRDAAVQTDLYHSPPPWPSVLPHLSPPDKELLEHGLGLGMGVRMPLSPREERERAALSYPSPLVDGAEVEGGTGKEEEHPWPADKSKWGMTWSGLKGSPVAATASPPL